MWEIFDTAYWYLKMLTLEGIVYLFVEILVKSEVQKSSTLAEKRNIWFCEVFFLSVFGYLFKQLVNHFPIILWGMASLMVLYFLLQYLIGSRLWQELEYFGWWREFEAFVHTDNANECVDNPPPPPGIVKAALNYVSSSSLAYYPLAVLQYITLCRPICWLRSALYLVGSYILHAYQYIRRHPDAIQQSTISQNPSPISTGNSGYSPFSTSNSFGPSYENSSQSRLLMAPAQAAAQERLRNQYQVNERPGLGGNCPVVGSAGLAPQSNYRYGVATGPLQGYYYPAGVLNPYPVPQQSQNYSVQQNSVFRPAMSDVGASYNRKPSGAGYSGDVPYSGGLGTQAGFNPAPARWGSNNISQSGLCNQPGMYNQAGINQAAGFNLPGGFNQPVMYSQPAAFNLPGILQNQPGRSGDNGGIVSQAPPQNEATGSTWWSSAKNLISSSASAIRLRGSAQPEGFTPPGLPNGGNNLCFLNSALQLLCRTPSFNTSLAINLLDCGGSSAIQNETERRFIDALTKTFAHMTSTQPRPTSATGMLGLGGSGGPEPVDTRDLRTVLSLLGDELVLGPDDLRHQRQQDVAEVLMWLIDKLSSVLNRKKSAEVANGRNGPAYLQNTGGYSAGPMDMAARDAMSVKNAAAIFVNQLRQRYSNDTVENMRAGARRAIADNAIRSTLFSLGLVQLSDADWMEQRQNSDSLVDDYFVGQLINIRRCLGCHTVQVSTQPFSILTINILPDNSVCSLDDCLNRTYNTIERLSETNSLRCENCRKAGTTAVLSTPIHSSSASTLCRPPLRPPLEDLIYSPVLSGDGVRDASFSTSTPVSGEKSLGLDLVGRSPCEQLTLLRLPGECVALHLLRFNVNHQSNQASKISTRVRFPLSNLSLHVFTVDSLLNGVVGDTHRYFLYAFCVHLGSESTSSGHYETYACCDVPVEPLGMCVDGNKKWFRFDDERVTPVDIESVIASSYIQENVYLLMYRKARATQF